MEKITTISCKKCKTNFESFTGKRRELCKDCLDKNKKEQGYISSINRMIRNRNFIKKYKSDKKCEICGYNNSPSILEFHHKKRSKKYKEVNALSKTLKNIETIKKEIRKCILVCPNCHAELHSKEGHFPWRKYDRENNNKN